MIAADEDALICDLAETYGVLDYRALPPSLVAVLSVGLRDNARIKLKMSGMKASIEQLMLVNAVDCLRWLVWAQTEDGLKGRNQPAQFSKIILGKDDSGNKLTSFASPEEFEAARRAILEGKNNAGN